MRQPFGIVGVGYVHLHVERLLGVTRIETDHWQAFGRERNPKLDGHRSGLESNTHRSRNVPAHCRGARSRLSLASASPNPIARFIEHVNLRFFSDTLSPTYCVMAALSGCLCGDDQAESESHQVISHRLARILPCSVIRDQKVDFSSRQYPPTSLALLLMPLS
jgi:hypothetical protein